MNKRILKLFNEAGFHQPEMERLGIEDKFEKFAELLLGNVLDIVANADMTELEGPDPEDVLYVACKQIKEHFGVEE